MAYGGLLMLVMVAFWAWGLYDAITTPAAAARNLPKVAWVFIVFLFFPLGAFAWALFGRPQASDAGRARRWVGGEAPTTLGGRLESDSERQERERREYYRRMDEELDRRLAEKRAEHEDDDDR